MPASWFQFLLKPKSSFSELTEHCQAAQKADLIGVITEITTKTLRRADKTDLSGNELLVSVMGKSLQGFEVVGLSRGQVVQVENATVLAQR